MEDPGSRTFRSGSSLTDVLLSEYHSHPESYKDVIIRFEDGSSFESSRLLLSSLSEVLFESLCSIPPWEEAEILAPGLNPEDARYLLSSLLVGPESKDLKDIECLEEPIKAFGFNVPPKMERRLLAYYCEDCDVYCPKDGILAHVRDFHPLSRKAVSSPIWSFFEDTEHPDFHLCRECKAVIKDKSTTNTELIRHLEVQHPDSYEEYLIQGGGNESGQRLLPRPALDRFALKRRSVIWKYFSESSLESGFSSCNTCGRGFKYRGQTSSMIRHLKFKHPDIYADYAQSTLMAGNSGKFGLMEEELLDHESMGVEELVAVSTGMPEAGEALVQESKILKRSPLVSYFERQSGASAYDFDCKSCSVSFNLGIQSTSDMVKHLKNKHPQLYDELIEGFLEEEEDVYFPEDEEEDSIWHGNDIMQEESEEEDIGGGVSPKKSSIAWQYFESTDVADVNACKLCTQVLKCKKKNTSTMVRHLRRAHPEVFLKVDRAKPPMEVEFNDEIEYFVDFFVPTEDDVALSECKVCMKVFREENIQGQIAHMKMEHPDVYEDACRRKQMEAQTPVTTRASSAATSSGGSKVKKRSLIWNYFNQTATPGVNSCMMCLKTFKCKEQTTSSMIRHLKSDHKEVYEEFSTMTASMYGRKIGESFQKYSPVTSIKDEPDLSPQGPEDDNMHDPETESTSLPSEGLKVINNKLFKRRSSIWNYFDPTEIPETNACKMCKKEFKCKGRTTSSMIRHLKKVHIESFKEFLRFRSVPQEFYGTVKVEEKSGSGKSKSSDLVLQYFERSDKNPDCKECRQCKTGITKIQGKKGLAILVRHLEDNHPDDYEAYLSQGGLPAVDDSAKVCSECGEKFSNRGSLTQHMKSVHAASCPYKCLECNASFTRRESYEQHSHDKNKPRNFLCTICGKTFARRSIRNFHEKAHKGDKKYQCGYCPKKFLTNQRKYKHERTHTGEKPYQCTECGRQFTQSHHLVTHARIHTGQKPYTCNFCPQTFRHLSSRNNHKCEGKMRNTGGNSAGPVGDSQVLPVNNG